MTEEQIKQMIADATIGFLTKEEFGRSAAYIRKQGEAVDGLTSMIGAIVEKGEDGAFKLKVASPAPASETKREGKTPEWQQEIDLLKAEIKKRDDALISEKNKAQAESKKSAVVDALSRLGGVNPQRDHMHLLDHITRKEDGSYIAKVKDEHGLDVEVGLDSHVSAWLKANPELSKPNSNTGSGTPTGAATSKLGTVDLSDFKAYQRNRSKINSGEIQVA